MDVYRALRPALGLIDPERAHRLAIRALASGLVPGERGTDDPVLGSRVWDTEFRNPVGLAAGFDKHAEVPDRLLALGFGFVETGTVTPRPQPGNARPRLFRLAADEAVINRNGFNSQGLDVYAARLAGRPRGTGPVGANLGRNKDTTDEGSDYVRGIEATAPLVDYLVVNVSSPNTPGLRSLQGRDALERLIAAAIEARARAVPAGRKPPLLVKLAPDLDEAGLADVAAVALASGLDGLVMSNTTLSRPPGLRSARAGEAGGLSGRPLFELSTRKLADLYRLTAGRIPLMGAGGISSGPDAYAKIRAGASLVQLYSALVFEGPGLVARLKRDLAALLRRDGFASVAEAVGADHR